MISPRDARAESLSRAEYTQDEMEAQFTASLLSVLKLPPKIRSAVYDEAESMGRRRPVLTDFRTVFSSLPIYITAARKTNIRDNVTMARLFSGRQITKHKFIQNFLEDRALLEGELQGGAMIQLLDWPLCGTFMLHDVPGVKRPAPAVSVTFTLRNDSQNVHRLKLESLDNLPGLLAEAGVTPDQFNA